MTKQNIIKEKSYEFALDIIGIYKQLVNEQKEYVLSKQLLKSGTSIGANVQEAMEGQSRADFVHKLSIALKEARETQYWISLIFDAGYLSGSREISTKCEELIFIITAIIKKTKTHDL